MDLSAAERRTAPRFEMRIPVRLHCGDTLHPAFTRDVSATGIFFFLNSEKLEEGSRIEFTITFPPEITLSTNVHVRCEGRVLRTTEAPSPGYGLGVAAKIEKYHFISAADA